MSAESIRSLTFEEFLAEEQRGDVRHEFVSGRVYAMSGATERHDLLAGLVFDAFAVQARAGGCYRGGRRFLSNRLARLEGQGYYPDVLVVCGPSGEVHNETDVTVVVEVLSPSTEGYDRREKALAYGRAPGFEVLVLLDPERRRAEVGRRGPGGLMWEVAGSGHPVVTSVGDLDIDALHDELDRTAST